MKERGGQILPRKQAQKDWYVTPLPTAKIARIREAIDEYLARIESEGRTEFESEMDMYESPAVRRIWEDLGIEHGRVAKWAEPGIALAILGGTTWLGLGPILEAVKGVAARTDNRQKLAAGNWEHRHLFAFIDHTSYAAWLCLREVQGGPLPVLPPEVTHVWAAGLFGSRAAGLYGSVASGRWTRFGPVEVVNDAA